MMIKRAQALGLGHYERAWEIVPVPACQGLKLRNLQAQAVSLVYADQKNLLEDLYSRKDEGVFVASHQLVEGPSGALQSIGVWTEGVASVLPHSDLVVLQELDEARADVRRRVIVPFAEVERQLPTLLEPVEGLAPPRYRTLGFPGQDVWAQLEAMAVLLPAKR